MSVARYFVFQYGARWLVTLDGTPVSRRDSRTQALASAIVMADLMGSMHHDADVIVDDEGRLSIAWTYGIDHVPVQELEAAA